MLPDYQKLNREYQKKKSVAITFICVKTTIHKSKHMIFRYTQFTFMVLAHFLYSIKICHAQPPCENMIQYPESPIHVEALNTTTTISSTQYAGDYALITAILSGSTYQITSSAGDYITVRDALTNNVLVHSVSPVSFISSTDNDIHVHFNLNDNACGTEEVNRTTNITCTSCQPPPTAPPCENTIQFPGEAIMASVFDETITIATSQHAGEFAIITGITSGNSYQFNSDVDDYITVRDAVTNNVLTHGVSPLSYTTMTSNDIELHFNLNDNACGMESVPRTTTISCTTCPSLCDNTSQYPTNAITAPNSNSIITIAPEQYAGEFAIITGIHIGNTYQLASDAGDYITVRDATTNSVLTHGVSPILFTASTANSIEVHFNLNDNSCGTESIPRTTTITCPSCPYSGPPPCENVVQYPLELIHAGIYDNPTTISSEQYAGEFAIITDIISGSTYHLNSDAGDYITVRDAMTNNVLIHGVSPISYNPNTNNDIEIHFNLDDNACGTEDVDRSTTITCSSCPQPPPPPSNDNCSNPINLTSTLNSSCDFTTATFISATVSTNPSVCFDDQEYPDIWFSFQSLSRNHVIEIANCQAPSDAILFALYEESCMANELDCQVIELVDFAGSYELEDLTQGRTYYLRLTEGAGTTPTMDICVKGLADCSTLVTSNGATGPGSLREALSCAENSAVITFDPMMHGQTVQLDLPAILLGNEVTISANPSDLITISNLQSSNTQTLLQIQNVVTLDGVKIVGQSPESMIIHVDPGGAINLKNSGLEKVSINN